MFSSWTANWPKRYYRCDADIIIAANRQQRFRVAYTGSHYSRRTSGTSGSKVSRFVFHVFMQRGAYHSASIIENELQLFFLDTLG
jgi:hypothetical protein